MGYPDCDSTFWSFIDGCEAAGQVVLFSAGNEGSAPDTLRRPADRATDDYRNVAVAAVEAGVPGWPIAWFSSRGPTYCTPGGTAAIKPDISAPGVDVRSSIPGGGYGDKDGTSMASPHINGVVALMREANPDLTVDEVKQILFDTAVDLGSAGEDNTYGWGMVDAYEAVQAALLAAYGFRFDTDPDSYDLCSPPADEAVYTIEVAQLGDFDETVTLSASGVPAGAIVDFTIDSAVPPFTSVMTVSSLIGAAPDAYTIEILGSSPSMERSTPVYLEISDGVPGAPTLTSPADGDSDVPLLPELTWEPAVQAREYELEIATDAGFTNVVYSATTDETSHTPDTHLDTRTRYYWHVRGVNVCGQGGYSEPFDFLTVNLIVPQTYDMLNGETGTYTYFDDIYDGDGDPTQALSPLSNGLGELVDGVIATENWNVNNRPYVGWNTIDPTITFHFDGQTQIRMVTIHVDDSNGSGGVYPPEDVTLVMGGETLVFPVPDPPGGEPFAFTMDDLDLEGETLELTIADYSSYGSYMMLSEVEIYGGACLGDLDGDGTIGLGDLAILLAHYPTDSGAQPDEGDLDGDGDIDLADLAVLLSIYETDCP
jgi:hypothetical protein